jgi:hypothetical protein
MSYWPRVRKQFQENFPLVLYNIIWAALNLFGYVLLQTANFNTGSLLIFLSTSMSFFGITILFMPNHNLVKPPPEMSQAQVCYILSPISFCDLWTDFPILVCFNS